MRYNCAILNGPAELSIVMSPFSLPSSSAPEARSLLRNYYSSDDGERREGEGSQLAAQLSLSVFFLFPFLVRGNI